MVTLWCRCIPDGKFQHAMGMAVECRILDKMEKAIAQCDKIYKVMRTSLLLIQPLHILMYKDLSLELVLGN
jgi:hypothetical protein